MSVRINSGNNERKFRGKVLQDTTLHEKCAVFGAFGIEGDASRTTFYGLWALQHRGQESSGIVSSDGASFYQHGSSGLVASVYRPEDLEKLVGDIAIGHNRYSTSGAADDAHVQPILKPEAKLAFAHNGNFPVTDRLEKFLTDRGVNYDDLNDSEMMAEVIATFMKQDKLSLEEAIVHSYPLFEGTFSAVAMTTDKLVAFRDSNGIRPLSIASLDEGYVVASETCAFDTVGATFIRDVKPGEMVTIDTDGVHARQVVPGKLKLDIFEFVYFARPDSVIEGKSVNQVREKMGEELAKQFKINADYVVPVPDSGIPAAIGFARASGIPFEMGLIKNRYIHRTFIRPSAHLRDQDLKMKLNPIPEVLKDKRIILVDDSIVRGTTTGKIAHMLYEAGAKEVHIVISSPPVKYPDFYGINLPNQADLIAHRMSVPAIQKHLGVDSLNYLSYDRMIRATGMPASSFSTACFNGIYPTSIGRHQDNIKETYESNAEVTLKSAAEQEDVPAIIPTVVTL